jgi:hypothetical protein
MPGAHVERLQAAAATDVNLGSAFLRAVLVDPPTAPMSPRIAVRVLRHGATCRLHPQHETPPVGSDERWQAPTAG